MTEDNSGIVYILKNESMPGIFKIGCTKNGLGGRMKELDSTGVPLPFECFYARRVSNMDYVEKQLHAAFLDQHLRKNREFFRILPERVKAALEIAPGEEVTIGEDAIGESLDDVEAINRERQRRPYFRFSMVGIKPGETLVHWKDPTATCTVHDDRLVDFEGRVTSLTESAGTVLQRLGYSPNVAGTDFWTYNGTALWDLRNAAEGTTD